MRSLETGRERQREFERILWELLCQSQLLRSEEYIQHGDTSVLEHSVAVACYAVYLAARFHIAVNYRELVRGALLHDYFLYDWHEKDRSHRLHGFRHPYTALRNAMQVYDLSPVEQDIIKKHMFPLTPFPPKYRESILVCIADKVCSTYETLYLCGKLGVYFSGERSLRACMKRIHSGRLAQ